MDELKIISNSSLETMEIAKSFAKLLSKGDIIVLSGELGAGKTKFTEGFLSFFNMQDEISSPTFNIVNEYTSSTTCIYHFDVYRLESSDEFYAIGGEEYFEKGICLIEWGEIIKDALPQNYIEIKIEKDSNFENKRILNFKSNGEKYKKILSTLKEELN